MQYENNIKSLLGCHSVLLASVLGLSVTARAQAPLPAPADSATYVLHKFAQPIGREAYRLTQTAQADTYNVRFRFVDRGSLVALRARLTTTPTSESLMTSQ